MKKNKLIPVNMGSGTARGGRLLCKQEYADGFDSHRLHLLVGKQTAIKYTQLSKRYVGSNPTDCISNHGGMVHAIVKNKVYC